MEFFFAFFATKTACTFCYPHVIFALGHAYTQAIIGPQILGQNEGENWTKSLYRRNALKVPGDFGLAGPKIRPFFQLNFFAKKNEFLGIFFINFASKKMGKILN